MEHKHRVFFQGYPLLSADYYVNVIAGTLKKFRAILANHFYFLRSGNFAVAERGDGTWVCDEAYYQSLSPSCDLLVVLVEGSTTQGLAPRDSLRRSNFLISCLRISSVMGNVPMSHGNTSSDETLPTMASLSDGVGGTPRELQALEQCVVPFSSTSYHIPVN